MAAGRNVAERAPLTVPLIVSTAIESADEGGLEAVSMRRIGDRLGTTAMALYRHVPSRDRLVELMIDEVIGEFGYPLPQPKRWRDALEAAAWQDWRSYFAHPWMLAASATTRPPLGPNMLAAMEWTLAALDGLGLAEHERLFMLGTVTSYGQGLALNWVQDGPAGDPTAANRWWQERLSATGQARPQLAAVAAALNSPQAPIEPDREFAFGLARVLDGIQAYLRRRNRDGGRKT